VRSWGPNVCTGPQSSAALGRAHFCGWEAQAGRNMDSFGFSFEAVSGLA